jgi:hypothetical protein
MFSAIFKRPFWNFLGRGTVDFVSRPASPRPLAVLRIGLAAVLLAQAFALAGNLQDLFGEYGIVQWAVSPFKAPGEVPSVNGIRSLLAPLGVSGATAVQLVFFTYVFCLVCLLVGWKTRVFAVIAWLTHMALKTTGSTSIYGVDDFAHIGLFYCVWMPVGYAWSLDQRSGSVSDEATPLARLSLRVLQLHLCVVYISSGIEKAAGEQWQNGEAIWRAMMRRDLGQFDVSWLADYSWIAVALCWVTLVVEIGYGLMIWNRWTRKLWAVATIGMHLGIGVGMGLLSFAAVMIVFNVAALLIPSEPAETRNAKSPTNPQPEIRNPHRISRPKKATIGTGE